MPEPRMRWAILLTTALLACMAVVTLEAQEPSDELATTAGESEDAETGAVEPVLDGELLTEKQVETLAREGEINEDPDAQRRLQRELQREPATDDPPFALDAYGSVRLHVINAYLVDSGTRDAKLGDGASRIGATADWRWANGWTLHGRLESGFDALDTFTQKAQTDDGAFFTPRLYNLSFETDNVYAKVGKSWSVYYKVAGAADRFAIFGGQAAGVYNAGTDGGATGTGRADEALQTEIYLDFERWMTIRPFNLNIQFQDGQPIPGVEGVNYGHAWSLSAWQETRRGIGVGVAWHRAEIEQPMDPRLARVAIDSDAQAAALALKSAGDRWYASLVFSHLENIETNDQGVYFHGQGVELFAQWQLRDRWWITGGVNWLEPESDENQAGEYLVRNGVLGLRYTFDDLHRMAYAEWRIDEGRLANGQESRDEFTIGIRWDFGY